MRRRNHVFALKKHEGEPSRRHVQRFVIVKFQLLDKGKTLILFHDEFQPCLLYTSVFAIQADTTLIDKIFKELLLFTAEPLRLG